MKPEDWIALAGILATVLVSVITLSANQRREKQQQERDDRLRKEQLERDDRLHKEQLEREAEEDWKRRTYAPHIEFEVRCNFYGPEGDHVAAEFLLVSRNKGLVQQKFKDIHLRVRGIEGDQPFSYWQDNAPRLDFPVKLMDNTSILPKDYNYFFVEPGVEQVFTYVTRIPAAVKYILAHAEFTYDQFTPHTAERVFAVNAPVILR